MDAHVLDGPAVALLLELEQQGFELAVTADHRLHVAPGSRLTPAQRRLLVEYKDAVLLLLGTCDPGVIARRDAFRAQLDAAERVLLPALVFVPDVPYVVGRCFSCGDANSRATHGRCWRCSLAWRLACRVPVSADLGLVFDSAREVA